MVERVGFFREDTVQGREEVAERAVRTDVGWVTRGRTDAAAGSRAPRPLFAPDSECPETSRPGRCLMTPASSLPTGSHKCRVLRKMVNLS